MAIIIIKNIKDVVYIDPEIFDNTQTIKMAMELEKINDELKRANRPYILIGPGRWGSSDRFLGIPVRWSQINQAKIIIETSLKKFTVESSQGSHFFHNLVAMNVGYFTISHLSETNFINYDLLAKYSMFIKRGYFVHAVCERNLEVRIDGRVGESIIMFDES